jgi:predicted alpha/beta hydrolase family esterase
VQNAVSSPRTDATVLFVPGLRGHVADHWQTLLARDLPGSRTVPPEPTHPLRRDVRVANLAREVAAIEGDIILVGHSAGVLITAHWADIARRTAGTRIRGALLVTPADLERPLPAGYPTHEELAANDWLPVPRVELPFPSILAASTNDPLARFDRTETLARCWGCALENLGDVGHMNPASGYGPWPAALKFIDRLSCHHHE